MEKTVVACSKVDSGFVLVSTVLLPYSFGAPYETMVFKAAEDGEVQSWSDLDCDRYDSESEALTGHNAMVNRWRK